MKEHSSEERREMEAIGLVDIGEANKKSLSERRKKRGECPTCGNRTHKIGMFGKKTPLTVEGACVLGRCLRCHPIEGYQIRPQAPRLQAPRLQEPEPSFPGHNGPVAGRQIFVPDDSDSVVSGITMDAALIRSTRRWRLQGDHFDEEEEEEECPPALRPRRPEPSVCEDPFPVMDSIGKDLHLPRRPHAGLGPPARHPWESPVPSFKRPSRTSDISHPPEPPRRRELSPHRGNIRPVRPLDIVEEFTESSSQKKSSESSGFLYSKPTDNGGPQMYGDLPRYPSQSGLTYEREESKREVQAPDAVHENVWEQNDPNIAINMAKLRPPAPAHRDVLFIPERKPPPQDVSGPVNPPTIHNHHISPARQPGKRPLSPPVSQIPDITRLLDSKDADTDPTFRIQRLHALAELVWRKGDEAKKVFQRNHGIETLASVMWKCLGDPEVQVASIQLLFALSACLEDDMESDVLTGESARNVIDALLVSMQTHISVESLQINGCGVFGCLASASFGNKQVDDGTLSGAVACVATAMDAHRKSLGVQKWGLRALYCQCVLSANAEDSQMSLAKGAREAGGVDVIYRAMDFLESDLVSLEWGCRLYWSLSFSDEIVGILTGDDRAVKAIMKVLRFHQHNTAAWALEEAAYGALANIARIHKSHGWLRENKIIARVFESMEAFEDKEGLNIEACALLTNLAVTVPLREAAQQYGVPIIFRVMGKFPYSVDLQEEAMRALLCLSIDSEQVKADVSTDQFLTLILQALRHHGQSLPLQATAFALMGSLCVRNSPGQFAAFRDVTDLLVKTMQESAEERKLQEIVCLVLRNLACRVQGPDDMQFHFFPDLVRVMKAQASSEIVQLNSCCVLWNLSARRQEEPASATDESCTDQVVAVIKSYIESAAVVEMACGALWHLIAGSEERKRSVSDSEGINFVKTALLMHPQSQPTLEMACGVLSCLSASPSLVRDVADDQGISLVVETMRSNPNDLLLLEYSSLILRNVVLGNSMYAAEASGGISTIIGALKKSTDEDTLQSTDEDTFQTEACTVLWAMAAQSEDCKQKIVALDGAPLLSFLADNANAEEGAREAAREAFLQLSRHSADTHR